MRYACVSPFFSQRLNIRARMLPASQRALPIKKRRTTISRRARSDGDLSLTKRRIPRRRARSEGNLPGAGAVTPVAIAHLPSNLVEHIARQLTCLNNVGRLAQTASKLRADVAPVERNMIDARRKRTSAVKRIQAAERGRLKSLVPRRMRCHNPVWNELG